MLEKTEMTEKYKTWVDEVSITYSSFQPLSEAIQNVLFEKILKFSPEIN
jgi:hypothetical protein